jgi:hypothetical protein
MTPSSVFRIPPFPNPPVPLPQVPGPKLGPFSCTGYADDIEFINPLGQDDNKDSYVFEVKLNGKGPYALKMMSSPVQSALFAY